MSRDVRFVPTKTCPKMQLISQFLREEPHATVSTELQCAAYKLFCKSCTGRVEALGNGRAEDKRETQCFQCIFLGGPHCKDHSILGSILGSP